MLSEIIEKIQKEDLTDYQPIPFWSWNAELKPEELVRQIRWMKANGMGGFFMHARSGLKTAYMSDQWMKCVEVCADEGEALGMHAWAYDENGWPSGFAGGKLLEDEANRDQYILYRIGEPDPEATVSYLLTEQQIIRVSRKIEKEKAAGRYLNLYIHTAASTADILNPAVVDKFLQETHEKYKAHFGKDFSKKIKGFFTDEPQYQRWNTPYTPMIAKYFKEVYGQDILDQLGLLFVEKEGYRTFRYRYWKGMQELMLRNFAEKLFTWCEREGVKLTGHYVEENWLGWQLVCCGGCMPFYEYEHIPGIDWLGNSSDNELAPRQVSSVAAQLGKKQVLTETFGCCGWSISPGDLRRIAAFQYVNGVNLMCQHLIPYAEYGNRKHDYPAHYSPINPWVKEAFGTFNDYFTRLGYLLTEGKEQVNVAMLHPIRSAYFDYKRELEAEGFGVDGLHCALMQACRSLSGANVAYHFLDETLLEKYGFVKNGRIGCGLREYDYLVLPKLETMGKETERLLRTYMEQGGKLLLLGGKPKYLEGESYAYDYLENTCTLEEIILAQPYRVMNRETEIYSTCRRIGDDTFLFAVNASAEDAYTQTFDLGEKVTSFLKVNLNTWRAVRVPTRMTLKPGEAVVLFAEEQREPKLYRLRFQNAKVSFEENYMPIDFVRYSEDGVHYSEKYPCAALFQKLLQEQKEGILYIKYEFVVKEKPQVIALRMEDCRAEAVTLNGVALKQMAFPKEDHVLAYDIAPYIKEGCNEYCVKINWYQNPSVYYALFDENVTESLKNCIVYDSELEPIYLVGQFGVYAEGGFIESEDGRFASAEDFFIGAVPGQVTEPVKEGFPFIRGALTLKQKVSLEEKDILLQVDGCYHLADVRVNGQFAGRLLFERELDISEFSREGENEVEVRFVLGNYNLLGPQHLEGEKEGFISPYSFTLNGTWKDNESIFFHKTYDLRKLYS